MQQQQGRQPHPTIVAALARGFEAIGAQPLLVLLPILFDLFYWLGPRRTLESAASTALEVFDDPAFADMGLPAEQIELFRELTTSLAEAFNAFAARPPFPLGLPRLYGVFHPGPTPLPAQVSSASGLSEVTLLAVIATVIGLTAYTLYLGLIATQVEHRQLNANTIAPLLQRLPRLMASLVVLLVVGLAIFIGVTFALSLVVSVLLLMGLAIIVILAEIVLLLVFLWAVLVATYTIFSLLLENQPLSQALRRSIKLLRTYGGIFGLTVLVGLLSLLLGSIWALPPGDTWVTLVSIVGHAVVSTGFIIAMFVFYQSRYEALFPPPTPTPILAEDTATTFEEFE